MLIDDFLQYQKQYQDQYGPRTAVLMEVGSFYESYEADGIGDVLRIAELLNIQATRKSKAVAEVSKDNPRLCGFPSVSLHRFLAVLLAADYTIVVVSQTTPPPNPKRAVTGIYSPGTTMEETPSFDYNNLVCLALQEECLPNDCKSLSMAIAAVDVSTGHCSVYAAISSSDRGYAIEEGVRLLKSFNPREVVLLNMQQLYSPEDVRELLEINSRMVHTMSAPSAAVARISFQNEYLRDILHLRTGLLTSVEFLGLENKPLACVALVELLRFVKEHNEVAVQRLQKPVVLNDSRTLLLENNAIQQLNVLASGASSSGSNGSLYCVLRGLCSTNLGKRRLKDRLLFPLVDPVALRARYDTIDAFLQKNGMDMTHFSAVEDIINGMADVERLQRKVSLVTIHPYELHSLWLAYGTVQRLVQYLKGFEVLGNLLPTEEELDAFQDLVKDCDDTFCMSGLEKYNVNNMAESVFNPGVFPDVDAVESSVREARNFLDNLRGALSKALDASGAVTVKLENSEKDGHVVSTTKRRAESLLAAIRSAGQLSVGSVTIAASDFTSVVTTSTAARICCPQLREASNRAVAGCERLKALCKRRFEEAVRSLVDGRELALLAVVHFLAECDVAKGAAKAAFKYGYCKPRVVEADASFIDAEGVRHPIIERLQTGLQYVPNWVKLGIKVRDEDVHEMDGMLLYGCNSAGKSSLQKSIGLCSILAQAGLYVPAKSFTFSPFHKVMTRILGNDNIFKGQSSFATEMAELRGILSRCDQFSLVLGDEIANSTESTSALAIVTAAITRLAACRSKFVFATHLHALAAMDRVNRLPNVRHFHLQITYDEQAGSLCYDRRLKEGAGLAIYGLEVAKYVGLDEEFLSLANEIRREIVEADKLGHAVEARTSRYNARLFMQPCGVCGDKGSDTHHIHFQKDSNEAGLVGPYGHVHKNDLSNLVVLCERCHDRVHHGELDIQGYQLTGDGRQLVVIDSLAALTIDSTQHSATTLSTATTDVSRVELSPTQVKRKAAVGRKQHLRP